LEGLREEDLAVVALKVGFAAVAQEGAIGGDAIQASAAVFARLLAGAIAGGVAVTLGRVGRALDSRDALEAVPYWCCLRTHALPGWVT